MSSLAVIHIAKKELDLDDETYRDILKGVTGKTSSAKMNEKERGKVINEFIRLGFRKRPKPGSNSGRKALEGNYAPKLQALWISGWHLGVIRDNSDEALLKFVKRQTGLDHTRFLHYPEDARKAIEAIKKILEREGGVDWGPRSHAQPWLQSDQAKIGWAMLRRAASLGLFRLDMGGKARFETIAGKPGPLFTGADWVRIHQHYGKRIREALAKQQKTAAEKAGE